MKKKSFKFIGSPAAFSVVGVPHLATCIFLIFYNEPELGA